MTRRDSPVGVVVPMSLTPDRQVPLVVPPKREREPDYIDTAELASRLGITRRTLAGWRAAGEGPPWITLGARRIVYAWRDVQAWLDARRRR